MDLLFFLSALYWLLYYLVRFSPFFMGILFAMLLTLAQGYVIFRMIRRGEPIAKGAQKRRQQLLPFFFPPTPGRANGRSIPAAGNVSAAGKRSANDRFGRFHPTPSRREGTHPFPS